MFSQAHNGRFKIQKSCYKYKTSNLSMLLLHLLYLFNSLFSRTTWASQYEKGKTSENLNVAKMMAFWDDRHQLDHMQTTCTSLQTDNHTNTSSLNFYRSDALPDAQPCQSTEGIHTHTHTHTHTRLMALIPGLPG